MNLKLTQLWATKTKDDEWWSSFVTSPLGIALNYFVVDIKWFTPNKITLISFITALSAAAFMVLGGSASFIVAAILIQLSHIFDCMDGQMARYRKTSSLSGSYYDKLTDQIQVIVWFIAISYAEFLQSGDILPVFLAFIGVAFYTLRGYVKYVCMHLELSKEKDAQAENNIPVEEKPKAGIEFDFNANFKWFLSEQKKIFQFDEGVFIFMLSFSLLFNLITPMLWIFSISQVFYGLLRAYQRGMKLEHNTIEIIGK